MEKYTLVGTFAWQIDQLSFFHGRQIKKFENLESKGVSFIRQSILKAFSNITHNIDCICERTRVCVSNIFELFANVKLDPASNTRQTPDICRVSLLRIVFSLNRFNC